ncbi:hypothetical protein BJ878DRAFT_114149 [Calycina marina]|uniref:Uncharacterized protein n=1 Tax=Calycina marina TaxID=1763456 RepID=A0A9P7Z1I0_9HELO|nr:hypothetical protein BJ878DRAFT_114149 [Calycina marina]
MGPQSEGGPSGDQLTLPLRLAGDGSSMPCTQHHYSDEQRTRYQDRIQQDERLPRPNGGFVLENRSGESPSSSVNGRGRDRNVDAPRPSGEHNQSRTRNGRHPSGQIKERGECKKCGEPLMGQYVRALGGTYHLECFRCEDCGQIVAKKFFPVDKEDGEGQYPLCETDYFSRLDLICHKCNGALRSSYITALDRKYHVEHFTCSVCTTVFGSQDSYYEHDDQVYCHYHYSTQFAQRCNGCQTAILKQFVEIFRNGQNQHWHPECYMIHKFWNVRLASSQENSSPPQLDDSTDEVGRNAVRDDEEQMEEKVYRIWSVLSTFEESSAACISDMLLHVSNGAHVDGVLVAKKFIAHVEILFRCADTLDGTMEKVGSKGLSYSREAKLLCKKIVAFFSLLSKTQDTGVRKLGVTQELLALVTGLAHYLKLLIRICLQGVLRVEKDQKNSDALHQFLDGLGDMDSVKNDDRSLDYTTGTTGLAASSSDQCIACKKAIEDECARLGERRCHLTCVKCSNCSLELHQNLADVRWSEKEQLLLCNKCDGLAVESVAGFVRVSRLQQYVFLLRVALARLLEMLRNGGSLPHTSDDPNLNGYNSSEGHRLPDQDEPPLPRSDTRSKSYGGELNDAPPSSAYENTLNDVRRLRSTRMDKHLSSTIKKARNSRLIDQQGPGNADHQNSGFGPVHEGGGDNVETTEDMFPQNALTLDDIPRIVAAETARDQRPNANKYYRADLDSGPEPKFYIGHGRKPSNANDLNAPPEPTPQRREGGKRYFSELSALEYFIVRHVAVIAMQPLLEPHFSMEELLSLIETRKPTFWNKMGKAFKPDGKKGSKKKKVFGVPLEDIIDRDGADSTDGMGPGALRIPAILDDAVSTMRKMDLSVEGVFRKNGNIKRLNETVAAIDKDGCDAVDFSKDNVVQVAAILKKYLRDLPDPILTFKLNRLFIAASRVSDLKQRCRILHLTCCLLPKAHRDSLEILMSFFSWAASFHQVDDESGSKMDAHNLATVIAPNILYNNNKSGLGDDTLLSIEVVDALIKYNAQMCEIPEDLQSILSDPSLFQNGGEITTKEILKRYGDLGAAGGVKHMTGTPEVSSPGGISNKDRALAPVVTRVDTDSAQSHAWQKESSVRHVQNTFPPNTGGPSAQNAPLDQWQGHDLDSTTPYNHRNGNHTPDSQFDQRRDRNSAWGRPRNGGSVPVSD